jgi:hypothetical protein
MVSGNQSYPRVNLFCSEEWKGRAKELRIHTSRFVIERFRLLKVAKLRSGQLADIETWPSAQDLDCPPELEGKGCDWVMYRKLASDDIPSHAGRGTVVTPYSYSPFLDLTCEVNVKKTVLSHLQRTERKITREIGPLSLLEANDTNKEKWYRTWRDYQIAYGRFGRQQLAMFRHWTTADQLPPWMKLMALQAGDVTLAVGLFYMWGGTFYYYAPVMSPDPALRRYGPGKLFVHKLIEFARKNDCLTFDFLQGEHEYKFHWNPQLRQLYQCIVPLTFKGHVALFLFQAKRWLRSRFGLAERYHGEGTVLPKLKEAIL